MLKVAPTLIVDTIEPSLKFWTETLGFTKVAEVPGDHGLVFAMVVNGNVEVHFQSRASTKKDMPYLAESQMPKTFYGATHFFIREPGGHVIGFSQNE